VFNLNSGISARFTVAKDELELKGVSLTRAGKQYIALRLKIHSYNILTIFGAKKTE
jgi:hypothetical protein